VSHSSNVQVSSLPDPASVGEISGRSVVLAYSNVASEYDALRHFAIAIDRSHRARMRISGQKAAEVLAGLVTNDVIALQPGHGLYAAALTAKGRITTDLRIFAEEGSFLVDVPARAAEGWWATLKKFVNPRVAPYVDESAGLRDLGIFGAQARHVVSEMTGVNASALTALAPYGHASVAMDGGRVLVARVPDLPYEGFEIFAPVELFSVLWERAMAARATPAGLDVWEVARVEGGRPEWGIDIDDTTLAQEANLDDLQAISYTKGCYVGQEIIIRIKHRGHVAKKLAGLRFDTDQPIEPGAVIKSTGDKEIGRVTSVTFSPKLSSTIGLGYVRYEYLTPGTPLVVDGVAATTHELPLVRGSWYTD